MSYTPTAEQAAIVDAAKNGDHLVIEAGAGAGKTSTLKLVADGLGYGKTGVYVAYNKAIATDAAKSFPGNVICRTAHSFAYGAVGKHYRARLNGPRVPAQRTAILLGIRDPYRYDDKLAPLAPQQLARIAMETIQRFCYSADPHVTARHVPFVPGISDNPAVRKPFNTYVADLARKGWDEQIVPREGKLRFTHDCYLKIWAMSGPSLDADYVLLDEAQDSNPCVAALVTNQIHKGAQTIWVGDRSQAIYGWRGAVDAMATAPGERYTLSQSFRFGPAVADEANKWLSVLDADLRLTGYEAIGSQVVNTVDGPDAVLCRTNAEAFRRVLGAVDTGTPVALVGGGNEIRALAEAATELMAGRPTAHPELCAFTRWSEVQDYVSQDAAGQDLAVAVKLIDSYGPQEIISVLSRMVGEDQAQLVVSTAHKAKGREWHKVQIASDFREPVASEDNPDPQVSREDAMLAYVTVTRAQHVLGREGLAWVDRWVPGAALPATPTVEPERIPGLCFRCGGRPCSTCGPEEAARWSALVNQPAGVYYVNA